MKTLVFLLLVLPPSWSTQRLWQKDSDLDAELELEDGGVHSHEDPYTSAARVKTSDDVDKGYIPLCYTEPTDSKYTLECANGEFAQRWNGCIELGSQRVRCPKYHYPCNNIRPNGKEFYCSVTCKGDTFGGKRNDCIEAQVLPGGFTDLEVNDEKALEAAAAAVSTLARVIGASNPVSPCGKNISLVGVEKASSQVVAGTKYKLTLRLATHTGDDCATRVEKVCQKISVWEKLPFMCLGDRPCHELVQQENIECMESVDGQEGTESEDNAGKRLKRASPQEKEAKFPCEFDDDLLSPKFSGEGQLSPHDTSQYFKWKNNIIPYYYTNEKTKDEDKKVVRSVMDRFEEETCFKFLEKNKAEYEKKNEHSLEIYIEDNSCRGGFSGNVKKVVYKNKLELKLTSHVTNQNGEDCGTRGLIVHELMHVLGVGHTQRRSDRDNFVTVNYENLALAGASETIKEQYRKCQHCKLHDRIPYDCGSIMHYGTHFSDKVVILPKDVKTCKLESGSLLNRVWDAPAKDWELLNIIGNCLEPTRRQASPANINYAVEMHNIGKLFSGYDIMKGNPLPVEPVPVDPGFRQHIFEASYQSGSKTADRRYLQPDGTLISSCIGACFLTFGSTEISGSKSYQDSLTRKVGVSVGGSIGAWGGKFSASVGYKEVEEKTSSESNLFVISTASCCAYSAEMQTFNLPSLSQNFRNAVERLTEKYDQAIYLKLISAFGTHFIRKALMGSLYGEQSEISKEAWTTMQEQGIDISTSAELSASGYTANADFSSTDEGKKAKAFSSKAENQKTFTIGVKPPADGKKGTWLQKTITDPAPIELTLGGSLLDLLEHDDIKTKVSTAVKANMKKALDDYCGFLLKSGEAKTCSSPAADPAFPSPTSGYIPLCYTEPTDSKYTLECANGEFAQRWNGCIELGSQRVRCPKYHHPCNNIRPNGKEFHCSVDCISDTHGGKRTDCIGYIETPGIDLDALTSWGKWGEVEKCSYPHFVNRMELKYERRDILQDDTALNAIRLTCTDGRTISSSEGRWGGWGIVLPFGIYQPYMSTCPKGKFINKARIRSEAITTGDNTAANGIRFECTDGSEHNPFDGDWGSWRPWKSCQPGSAIYGIQTLVKASFKGDDTALNNVEFFCAKLPESGKV